MQDVKRDEELRRGAHRSMVGQAAAGVALYPVICTILGYAASIARRHPLPFFSLLALVILASALRGFLILRFDALHRRSPDLWERLHVAGVLSGALGWTAISCWAFLDLGLTGVTTFSLIGSTVICNLASMVYTPSLLLMRLVWIAVIGPHLGVFVAAGGVARQLIAPLTVVFGLYLWNAGNRLHRGYWQARSDARLLELRARELRRHRRHLEELVRERTASLEEAVADLETKNAELETRNAEMERFTYTISHDLKSPLITIRGFLGLLEKDMAAGRGDRAATDMERIRAATGHMARLLDELLELSRIGRLVNVPQEVCLGELAREAVELVAGAIAERGVEVEVAADLPVVCVDRPRLLEVFQNLVDNAVRFLGEQPAPRIEIGVRPAVGGAGPADPVVYVRDNGIGIEARYHEKIFGLFERLDHAVDGTGIGLALVKRIVEVHGGRIWVESEGEGRGSAFCFTLGRAPLGADQRRGRAGTREPL